MAAEGAGELVRVVTLLAAAVIAVPLFKRLGLGSVLGYLAAGLIIGPFGLKFFDDPQAIIHVAELGVVMFLFVIGLEMKPSHLWNLRRQIFGLGSMQVILAAAMLTFVGIAFGYPWQVAFVSASGFVLTSTAIVMQVLGERHELATPQGQSMVSILLFEDLLIVPLLAVVAFMAPTVPTATADTSLWMKLGMAVLSLAILVAAGRWLLNPMFGILAKSKAREVMTAAALLVVLGAALLMEWGGLSMAMGAFLAGVLLSESSFRHQLEADIEPFRGLLLGLFFLGVGMALDLNVVAQNWKLIVSGVLALMAAKAAVIYGVARLAKSSHADALERAVLMAQGGEFAFVLFSAAASQGVISGTVNANMTAIVVLSMALTPLFLIIHGRFSRKNGINLEGVESLNGDEALRGNVLIIGFGRVGQIASQAPIAYGAQISIIDNNPDIIRQADKDGFKVYYGDGAREDILHAAGAENADCILICIDDAHATTRIVEIAKHVCPNTRLIVRAFDREHAFELVKAQADFFVRETFEAAMSMGNEAVKMLGADESQSAEICERVRRTDKERFALEVAGDTFAGRALLLKNAPPKAPH
ncbi:monovalent cation:proton antiporter-2 (CPA2) family protein [Uruburuella suis]|uniref:Kef-type potassium/proton antiporter (CPA2 family) n=1 Tax=Uruburuella suis TaxID=252130 RepID=A0AAE9KGX9_9NEIS|nr:monovalent cation:proton antiporter-2 (CPA2) family protein [Uruburuella suis]TCP06963.1 Kef-type potassium/proton antiporter (CPA2 family) [Uruburuella suis]UOO79681.1 monovalent cation:proton antiporter-2 (CPA2) family protein [Uruburuella suis]